MKEYPIVVTRQDISREAYDQAKPTLASQRQRISRIIRMAGKPMTANEITAELGEDHDLSNDNVRARCCEMRKAGQIKVGAIVTDPVSTQKVNAYVPADSEVTGPLPVPRTTREELLKEAERWKAEAERLLKSLREWEAYAYSLEKRITVLKRQP